MPANFKQNCVGGVHNQVYITTLEMYKTEDSNLFGWKEEFLKKPIM